MVQGVAGAPGELAPGQIFAGRYRIERRLGEGTRKWTYLAEDVKVGDRLVVLSVVRPHASVLDPDGTKREANLLSRVKNNNHIVAFYDYDADGRVQYLVFEYLSGGPLADRIERAAGAGELIPLDLVVRYGRELAGALAQIHAAGVIHRDVAPHHIWLTDRQKVKLGGFDSAVLLDGESGPRPMTTEGYASPEERHRAPLDQRSDLYSLGRVLVSLALGELASGDPAIVRERRPDLPPAFHELLASLVAPSPDDRPSSAQEVLDRLNEIRRRGMDIYAVIAKGEGPQVEFKASMRFPRDDRLPPHLTDADREAALKRLYTDLEKAVLKTIAAFLNSQGGTLLVGVEDNGAVVGIEGDFGTFDEKQNVDIWQLNLKQKIINAFGSDVWAMLDLKLDVTYQGTVARIDCPPRAQPTWLNHEGNKAGPEFYIRAASSTEPLPVDKWSQYIKERWAS